MQRACLLREVQRAMRLLESCRPRQQGAQLEPAARRRARERRADKRQPLSDQPGHDGIDGHQCDFIRQQAFAGVRPAFAEPELDFSVAGDAIHPEVPQRGIAAPGDDLHAFGKGRRRRPGAAERFDRARPQRRAEQAEPFVFERADDARVKPGELLEAEPGSRDVEQAAVNGSLAQERVGCDPLCTGGVDQGESATHGDGDRAGFREHGRFRNNKGNLRYHVFRADGGEFALLQCLVAIASPSGRFRCGG
ncbi:hypothetical protein D3C81_972790 [compost metagenome]